MSAVRCGGWLTSHSRGIPPSEVVGEVNAVFTGFDRVVSENKAEKIWTIGDIYMTVCGFRTPVMGYAAAGCAIALGMCERKVPLGRLV